MSEHVTQESLSTFNTEFSQREDLLSFYLDTILRFFNSIWGLAIVNLVTVSIVVFHCFLIKQIIRSTAVMTQFSLDSLPARQMVLETLLNSAEISEAELEIRKADMHTEVNYYGGLNFAFILISSILELNIVLYFIGLLGGVVEGIRVLNPAVKT